jgi:trk system potassium uptake protein TrkA
MRVIVVGCGRVGSTLASQLDKKKYQVTVIDKEASAFDNLPVDFQGRMIVGDVLARGVLHRAEIEDADALAAVTNSDTLNALIAHIARTEYRVSKVVARNYDPRQRSIQEAFDIPVISSASWGAERIEDMLSDAPLHAIFSDANANIVIYQLEVPENWHGRTIEALLPPDRSQVLSWTRAGQPLHISDKQSLETGDLVYLSADQDEIQTLRGRLGIQQEHSE